MLATSIAVSTYSLRKSCSNYSFYLYSLKYAISISCASCSVLLVTDESYNANHKIMIKVKLKCFSQVKYALGADELTFELENGITCSKLETIVRQTAEGKLKDIDLRIAINQEYVKDDTELKDGDEVVLIPPVQGG